MHLFLTSSNLTLNGQYINEENGFRSLLFDVFPHHIHCLYIASDPIDTTHNDEWGNYQKKALMNSHFLVDTFTILDDRNKEKTEELVKESDLIILGGGHVPTQNKFFREIHLKK